VVVSLAEKHSVTPGQVVLRWHVQNGTIVIPKSNTPERIRANLDVMSFELSADEVAQITALDSDSRMGADPATANFTQFR
jgi:2,5-diketo-D-gluconate reductase A